ncbi:NADPH-dependent 7-cyano-7-deazaguanine reductase QueF [Desulfoluna spongiiphila]|uniref:NADPH-dependent 7-cyano-7-deazaguanine reductase QueF n=1 Tax=Desulfoluna spongiiphila TaxID=419481 RepID=UPI00125A9395|nr:NADPH-dependent 7-cyano-7-deazaguanine reductase QueF [Desulfoluna spongiiphila]VVS91375.1 nadph-dependent 7-cyano-7-deazaguanine reductase quef type 2 [Desulfoluna spongiiphila]
MRTENPLGKKIGYTFAYDPSQLFPVERSLGRGALGLDGKALPFCGEDIWTAWELSWLDGKGKPASAVAEIRFPATSRCIVESKSLKLYLNSFNMSRFESPEKVKEAMVADLSRVAEAEVAVLLFGCDDTEALKAHRATGRCIDHHEADSYVYEVDASLLAHGDGDVTDETLCSHILRTNCPVTGQPDWATVEITYSGKKIDEAALFAYLVSFRTHTGYHENCVETLYTDIMDRLAPAALTVVGRFTRRGGLDINPCRSSAPTAFSNRRLVRQ